MHLRTNIVVLSTSEKNKKKFATQLSMCLDMYLIDVQELLDYEFSCVIQKLNDAGEEYLRGAINKKIKAVSNYENSVIILPTESIFDNDNISMFKKNSLILNVVLKDSSMKKIIHIADDEREKMYESVAHITINCTQINMKQAVKFAVEKINFFKQNDKT